MSRASPAHFYHQSDEIPQTLPLLERVVARHVDEQPLAGVDALFFQHQLSNQVPMTNALKRIGLDPRRIHWVDIPYTSHQRVRDELQQLGIPKENFRICDDFDPLSPYAAYQRRRSVETYAELLAAEPDQLLVLDDGAYFLEAASCFETRFPRCAIVEQTSRGFKKLAKNAAMNALLDEIPLVDVARSVPKRELESPFIGAAVCASLMHHLRDWFRDATRRPRCLVLGHGSIGGAVTEFLASDAGVPHDQIRICDPKTRSGETVSGFETWKRTDGGRFDLIIGCSGSTSFDVGDTVFLNDGGALVSASSGAVEFNRRNLVEWASMSNSDDIHIEQDPEARGLHANLRIRVPGRNLTLLNGGFPANFDGRISCLPDRYIQITMALMVEAAVQAVRADSPGVHDLNRDVCLDLTDAYYDEVEDAEDWLPERAAVLGMI